ncbi:MAG: M23 family metallopeptidase [Bacteroidetes bacterium]|nr:M23 family metallopeptidase [Bacteroidota bacterium]
MAKIKYKFNPDNLAFEKFKRSRFEWFVRLAGIISAFIILSFGFYLVVSFFFETPREKIQKREIDYLQLQNKLQNERVEVLSNIVAELENRDENIYRNIFEAEPIPKSIRDAGYGGVEKYANLEGYSNSELVMESQKQIDKLSKKLYVLTKSYDDLEDLAAKKGEMLASIPAIQPVKTSDRMRIASGFGWRVHPLYKVIKFHEGLDFTGTVGSDIYATGDGVVVEVAYSRRGYGNKVVISHGFGYKTLYAHMQKFNVRRGQKVKRGEKIGTLGNTGLSIGPHLHYEVILNGRKINPVYFFHNDLSPEEYEKVLQLAEQANQALD